MNPIFLTIDEVIVIHASRIEKYGGSFGIRDQHLLESALSMPESGFGEEYLHPTIFLMAAAYLFHISKNHPFVDGNKRAALGVMLIFLKINNYELFTDGQSLEDIVMGTATGKLSKKDIAEFLEKNCRKG